MKQKVDAELKSLIPHEKNKHVFKVGKLNVSVSKDMMLKHPELVKRILKGAKNFEMN